MDVHPDGLTMHTLVGASGSLKADVSPAQQSDEDGSLSIDSSFDLTGSSSAIDPSPDSDASVDRSGGGDHVRAGTVSAGLDQKLNDVQLDAITQATDEATCGPAVTRFTRKVVEIKGKRLLPHQDHLDTHCENHESSRQIHYHYALLGQAPKKGRVM